MADWDVVGQAPAQLQNPWAVKSNAPAPTTAGDVAKGVGDAALSGVSKVATGMVGAPIALVNRLIAAATGGDGQLAADAAHEYVNRTFGHDTQTPVGKAIGAAVSNMVAPLAQSGQQDKQLLEQAGQKVGLPAGAVSNQLSEAGDIAGTAGLAAPIAAGAEASNAAEATAAAASPAARAGYRTAADHPVAAGAAGGSGTQALSIQNTQIANGRLGAEAGVPPGTALVPGESGSLAQGRTAPGSVYDRLETALPTAALSPKAAAMVNGAGSAENVLTAPSAATQATIDAQKAKLQGPLTGPQVVQTSRALRQEGGARLGSDDVEQQNLGSAQLDIARALEQHIADTLPPGSTVDLPQFQQARTALAKNYALQGAVKGGNVDLQAIARMQQRDPDLLTGEFQTAAQFANEHPGVTQWPNRIETPPSVANDLGKAMGGNVESLLSPAFWAHITGGQGLARRILTGSPGAAVEAAQGAPVSGLADEFAPRPPGALNLQPPPGSAGGPAQQSLALPPGTGRVLNPTGGLTASTPQAPAVAPPPGGISLADVLSHGVEQGPSQGLSLAPEGAPAAGGVPFQRNAAHEAGGLTLDELLGGPRTYGGTSANGDLPGVMSANVPDGTVSRAGRPNNASAGNPASLEGVAARDAALAKGVQPVSFGADDQAHPMSAHDIQRRDLNPAPDSIFINAKDGTIINSGNMAPRAAQALLARWKAIHGSGLGQAF